MLLCLKCLNITVLDVVTSFCHLCSTLYNIYETEFWKSLYSKGGNKNVWFLQGNNKKWLGIYGATTKKSRIHIYFYRVATKNAILLPQGDNTKCSWHLKAGSCWVRLQRVLVQPRDNWSCHRGQSCQSHSSPRVMSRQSIPSIYNADHGDNWAVESLDFGPSSFSKPLLAIYCCHFKNLCLYLSKVYAVWWPQKFSNWLRNNVENQTQNLQTPSNNRVIN